MEKARIRILIINKEESAIAQLKNLLSEEGFNLSVAKYGAVALEMAKQKRPDLIILDVEMDEIDGVDICHTLRGIPNLSNTLIAFFTKQKEDYVHVAALSAGADDYIIRPINDRVLLYRIKALLRQKMRQLTVFLQNTNPISNIQLNENGMGMEG